MGSFAVVFRFMLGGRIYGHSQQIIKSNTHFHSLPPIIPLFIVLNPIKFETFITSKRSSQIPSLI